MAATDRADQILALLDELGFLAVSELSERLNVSEMTIRRDLNQLQSQGRILRTYGGAASLRTRPRPDELDENCQGARPGGPVVDRVDVLIATSVNPKYDGLLLESLGRRNLPIIAESLAIQNEETVVAVDNFGAACELGRWAGEYARENWDRQAYLLDLGYHLSNTQARSRGFIAGLREILPEAEVVLSLNAQSRYSTAYQLTRDALAVHKNINIIFAINDTVAWGAINACLDLNIDPKSLIVLPFGLEGSTMRDALSEGKYCPVGLAMFPEIVGPTCVEAAIAAYNHRPLPQQLVTPHAVLTAATLPQMYQKGETGWQLRWEAASRQLQLPFPIDPTAGPDRTETSLPKRIGFIVPFFGHEWYKNLVASMQAYASGLKIEFEIVDAEQSLKDELDLRRRKIARLAAESVKPGEVILIDSGPIAPYLAECLAGKTGITVITNSSPVFDVLSKNPEITLISTGGAYRRSSQLLVGPTAENALREMRADKLFLMVTGITLNFGLSHTNISEVTIKQAMIRSARETILLADHTVFGQESVVQVAPLSVVDRLITDDALPASLRLDLTKQGIQIVLADM